MYQKSIESLRTFVEATIQKHTHTYIYIHKSACFKHYYTLSNNPHPGYRATSPNVIAARRQSELHKTSSIGCKKACLLKLYNVTWNGSWIKFRSKWNHTKINRSKSKTRSIQGIDCPFLSQFNTGLGIDKEMQEIGLTNRYKKLTKRYKRVLHANLDYIWSLQLGNATIITVPAARSHRTVRWWKSTYISKILGTVCENVGNVIKINELTYNCCCFIPCGDTKNGSGGGGQ
jgi:hypothetical protein